MNHIYHPRPVTARRLLFTTILLLIGLAQLPAQLLGTYYIGGLWADYSGISEAVADLEAEGISGPVTFIIRPGRYYTRATLRRITGASKYNTITFRSASGNSDDVMLINTAYSPETDFVLKFNNARHYRLLGLLIISESTEYPGTIKVINEAYDLRIEKCELVARPEVTNARDQSVVYLAPLWSSQIYIRDNKIFGGSSGIYFFGSRDRYSTDTQITGNEIYGFKYSGVSVSELDGGQLTGNVIRHSSRYSGARGILVRGWNGSNLRPVLIANNMISIVDSPSPAVGIYDSDYLQFYHNSLSKESGELLLDVTDVQNMAVINNILRSGTGLVASIERTAGFTMDYNDLYTTGGSFARWNGRTVGTFGKWRLVSGKDANSINVNPLFVGVADLHARSTSLIGAGTAVASVATDFDAQARNNPPCIGADEFNRYIKYPIWFGKSTVASVPQNHDTAGTDRDLTDSHVADGTSKRSVFPNPVEDELTVALSDAYKGPVTFTVLDALGRRMHEARYVKDDHQLRAALAVERLPAGAYQLHVAEGVKLSVKRFVKR